MKIISHLLCLSFLFIPIILCSNNGSLSIGDSEKFLELGGNLHGMAFDEAGFLYVCKNGKNIYKIGPDGSNSLFCTIDSTGAWNSQNSTYVWNFELSKDKHFYAAARNKILKISLEGEVTTLVQEQFTTTWGGVTGIELDSSGNIYVAYQHTIAVYSSFFDKTILFENDTCDFISLEFDRDYKYLYASGGSLYPSESKGKIYKFAVNPDGTLEEPEVIFESNNGRPEYIILDNNNNIYSSIFALNHNQDNIVQITNNDSINEFNLGGITENETMEFGKKGFDEKCIYLTTWSGSVYKVFMGNKGIPVSVIDDQSKFNNTIPIGMKLYQNYPNPFNPSTTISYFLNRTANVTLKIFNSVGEEVSVLVDNEQSIGEYEYSFDATNISSGIYYSFIKAGTQVSVKKMMLIR